MLKAVHSAASPDCFLPIVYRVMQHLSMDLLKYRMDVPAGHATLKRFQEAPLAPKKDKAGPSHEER